MPSDEGRALEVISPELLTWAQNPNRQASASPNVLDDLDSFGREILSDSRARAFSDLMTFAFSCRKTSLERQLTHVLPNTHGVGTVLHISPGNIAMNFAYSMVMGLCSGNSNIVKLPSKPFEQIALFLEIFERWTQQHRGSSLAEMVVFLQVSRDNPSIEKLVSLVDGLVVWGGDSTVAFFRGRAKKPTCRELYFPDRYSSCLIDAVSVLEASDQELDNLVRNFFNDSFLVDQNACSSPTTLVWVGLERNILQASSKFWVELENYVREHYESNSTVGVEKLVGLVDLVESLGHPVSIKKSSNLIWRYDGEAAKNVHLRFGQFVEKWSPSLLEAPKKLRGNEQTLTYFGTNKSEIEELARSAALAVDRICPVGRALEMGLHWDGKDVVSFLSRRTAID